MRWNSKSDFRCFAISGSDVAVRDLAFRKKQGDARGGKIGLSDIGPDIGLASESDSRGSSGLEWPRARRGRMFAALRVSPGMTSTRD
jgi:hypothetical protein